MTTAERQPQLCKAITKMLHDYANHFTAQGEHEAAAQLRAEGKKYWQQACYSGETK